MRVCFSLIQAAPGVAGQIVIDGAPRKMDFLPTRYLSTRTAVRAGRVLRAICVYDKLFASPNRPLVVQGKDFARLRLHLVDGHL